MTRDKGLCITMPVRGMHHIPLQAPDNSDLLPTSHTLLKNMISAAHRLAKTITKLYGCKSHL